MSVGRREGFGMRNLLLGAGLFFVVFTATSMIAQKARNKPPKATQLTAGVDDFQVAFTRQPFDRKSVEGAVYELQMTVKPKPGVPGGVQTYYFDKDCKFIGYGRFHTIPNPD